MHKAFPVEYAEPRMYKFTVNKHNKKVSVLRNELF